MRQIEAPNDDVPQPLPQCSAQAGVIAAGGEAYYHRMKGPGIAGLESEVDTKNREAIEQSNRDGSSKLSIPDSTRQTEL